MAVLPEVEAERRGAVALGVLPVAVKLSEQRASTTEERGRGDDLDPVGAASTAPTDRCSGVSEEDPGAHDRGRGRARPCVEVVQRVPARRVRQPLADRGMPIFPTMGGEDRR